MGAPFWQNVKFDTVNFSAFYFANLWVCFISTTILKSEILKLSFIGTNLVQNDLNIKGNSTQTQYLIQLFIYFLIVFITMALIMKPLNIHLPDSKSQGIETLLNSILIFGFFMFTFHKVFNVGMPREVPPQVVDLIMGDGRYLDGLGTNSSVLWGYASNFVWCFLPLGYMWYRVKTDK